MGLDARRSTVLLSLRPRFAAALLDGTKTVEVRRARARIGAGTVCLLYSSTPECAVVGAVEVAQTDIAPPPALWRRWGAYTGLLRHEFDDYLTGRSEATAIVVAARHRFVAPISLAGLRGRHAGFLAPQSYRYLVAGECHSLLDSCTIAS